jgi:Domain of unknown function DUF29
MGLALLSQGGGGPREAGPDHVVSYPTRTPERSQAQQKGAKMHLQHLVTNLAEELDTLGRSERNAAWSHLPILVLQPLMWAYQPDRRGVSPTAPSAVPRLSTSRQTRLGRMTWGPLVVGIRPMAGPPFPALL